MFEGAFDEGQAALGLFAEKFGVFAALGLESLQFVGDREGSEDGDFLGVDGARSGGYGVHFLVDKFGEFVDVGGLEIPLDGIGLAENFDFYGGGHKAVLAEHTTISGGENRVSPVELQQSGSPALTSNGTALSANGVLP